MAREKEIAIRRRLTLAALDLKPRDLREALGIHPMLISHTLNANRNLQAEEFVALTRLATQRLKELFAGK